MNLPLTMFSKKSAAKDGLNYYCKKCWAEAKNKYLASKGNAMTESKFRSIYNGLSSIAKQTYDIIPADQYWSIDRFMNEAYSKNKNWDKRVLSGTVETLRRVGLFNETSNGLFSKNVPKAKREEKPETTGTKTKPQEQKAMPQDNPMDLIRLMAIKLIDLSKQVSEIASAIDSQVSNAEKNIEEEEKKLEKLKQLQSLLKDLG